MHRRSAFVLLFATATLVAQQPAPTTAVAAASRDTSYIDAQGTAHITRVIPVPKDISTQAQLVLGRAEPDQGPPEPLAASARMLTRLAPAPPGPAFVPTSSWKTK